MTTRLENLLQRIADGTASDAEAAEARALLDADDGFGGWVRDAVSAEAGIDVADAVLAAIDADPLPLADAVRAEAGQADVSAEALVALDGTSWPIGDAVRAEAGAVDVSAAVHAALQGFDLGLAQAARAEAGGVDVADDVMKALQVQDSGGLDWMVAAVRDEAGTVDVADAVMSTLGSRTAMPDAAADAPKVPQPANRRWFRRLAVVAAAVALIGATGVVGGSAVIGGLIWGASSTTAPEGAGGGVQIASEGGSDQLLPSPDMVFASAAEIVVEDLSYGDGVQVFQDQGDAGAMILWVDEEVL